MPSIDLAFDLQPLGRCRWITARFLDSKGRLSAESQEMLVRATDGSNTANSESKREDLFRDQPALFREFAKLPPTKEAILPFAEEFGDLHPAPAVPGEIKIRRPPKPPPEVPFDPTQFYPMGARPGWEFAADYWQQWKDLGAVRGTTLAAWQSQICVMRLFLELWESAKSKDEEALSKIITASKRGQGVGVKTSGFGAKFSDVTLIPGITAYAEPEDLVGIAWILLIRYLPKHLPDDASLIFGRGERPTSLVFRFHTLRDALWAQFARAIRDGLKFIECENCGTSMEISLEAHRTNRTVCSNACKTAVYRKRRSRALDLYKKKWTPRQIAKEVGSDEETVKGWLNDHSAKKPRKSKGK